MQKKKFPRVQDVVGQIHALAPAALAEEWDNVGLQVGDPAAEVRRLCVALDPSSAVVAEAVAAEAQLLLTHHPLIFRPLKNLTPTDDAGRVLLQAARSELAVLCAHTNLDRARFGLNDWLAETLGLEQCTVLQTAGGDLFKLVVFVPCGYENAVASALFEGGAGHIGEYDQCSFRTVGSGTFRPGVHSNPFIGQVGGGRETVRELRLETVVPREHLARAVQRMVKAHPYEEVAYDLIPLHNRRLDVGLGRIGRLATAQSLDAFAARVRTALGCAAPRVVGDAECTVRKVAVCAGSGASLIGEAARQGVDVLVTGDVKYHEAQNALSQGLALIDAGHFATERILVPRLAEWLGQRFEERGWATEIMQARGEIDPFRMV
ncbi:Nif3-like dinuclear metal center hexameric protein [Geoalkalibacter halelectricus]|uniref:GTP cyclohydrolase 1 type 2 homolog n=1 Tax=Geoalkalibacter halelectricus TaxID=2847045 RepID=A0ABY5ZQR8_9BACT|nr:Nif3-like dinuclear metal center hexameric protein [Geoalkalibacter halelectricus]MDO3377648.1 Nif3-like dinuclear metal center hexameric protein [Geoalkalibacter halelectricus]UWZ81438.1 Nif3-like dinuclear metal center hexameric protein [Geoalkalibacter halelectricus]